MWINNNVSATDQRGPTDDFWYEPVAMRTATGARVNPELAMQLSVVFACVKILSETVAQLPLHLYQRLDRGKEKAINHPLYTLIHNRPNEWQTPYEWREMMQGHCVLRGNAYSEIKQSGNGRITDLIPLHPDRVEIKELSDTDWFYEYKTKSGNTRQLLRDNVFHLRGLSSDGVRGLNPVEIERETIGAAIAARDYGGTFFANDARPGGVIEFDGTFDTDEDRKQFRESWQAAQTGSNRRKTAVLEHGMKYHEIGINNADAQFLETMRFNVEEIARIFRIPTVLLGHESKASTYASAEQFFLSFVKFVMASWLKRWEEALSQSLITRTDLYFFEFNVDGLLRGDSKARSEFYRSAIETGWLTRNEVREKENMNPIDGLDDPLQPLNMGKGNQTESEPEQNDNEDRARVVMRKMAQRVVNKELIQIRRAMKNDDFMAWATHFYVNHANYVADSLALDTAKATAYCNASLMQIRDYRNDLNTLLTQWETHKAAELLRLCDE